jgi:hypothetical protein
MFRTDTVSLGSLEEMVLKNPRAAFASVMHSEQAMHFVRLLLHVKRPNSMYNMQPGCRGKLNLLSDDDELEKYLPKH